MVHELSPSARRVQAAIQERGFTSEVIELPGSTRTALEAAEAVGCGLGQIVKSLVFSTSKSREPILVLVSGINRVNENRLAELTREPIEKANGDFVREMTGFAIGGVPPLGHNRPICTYIDEDLLAFNEIWAAAGTPHALFRLKPTELVSMTGGEVTRIK